jgi:RNA polymerase sigma-54 factor
MRLDAGQYMQMDQRMKLSPRMIQSMEILQLPAMALEERIEQELESNPVLELAEVRSDTVDGRARDDEGTASDAYTNEQPIVAHDSESGQSTRDDFARLDDFAASQSDTWEYNTSESAEYRPRARREDGEPDAKMQAMANAAARAAPLTDQLLDQWRFVDVDARTRQAGELLISFIDDDGYIRVSMEDVAQQAPAGVSREDLPAALREVQRRLDPPGTGARDLSECLLLQIDGLIDSDDPDEDPDELALARSIVAGHLKDLEMNRLPRIAEKTGRSLDEVKRALGRIRRLDPRPGRQLAPDSPQVIVPDVIVEYDPIHDRYVAALNRGHQPALRINPRYRNLSKDRDQERSTRDFLSRSMSNARWLLDSIEQRRNTLLRVVNAVLEVQRDFLDHGEQHLKPLPMIQVADQLGVHVGTISRAVSEKYIQTPRGIYPLRMFFSGGTESDSGQEMSWTAVQHKLKEIIDAEDKADPLNDDQLVARLKAQGLDIARRTVAKYRSQLGIPPARRRKEY